MAEESFDASIFPDLITPEGAACVLTEWYGAGAVEAASASAAAALADNRCKDHRFWITVRGAILSDREAAAGAAPVTSGPLLETAPSKAGCGDDDALMHLPSVDELLRLIRQFARIADPDARDFAIEQIKAIAERHVVVLRGTRS